MKTKLRILTAMTLLALLAACSAPSASLLGRSVLGPNPLGTVTLTPGPTPIVATSNPVVIPAPAQPGSISVTGEAEVRVAPDQVILTLGVETSDLMLGIAKSKNDDIVQKVLALAQKSGVASKDIQTDFLNIEPRYDDSYLKHTFVAYFVRKTISITLRDLSQFESLLSGALEAGVNYVHGVDFRTSDLRKYRDQARSLAIQAAQEKAQAMAKDLGRSVGAATKVTEDRNWWSSGYSAWWGGAWNSASQNVVQNAGNAPSVEGPLAPGMISVTADVTVEFELK
jgi:uncharacterized protein YggE